jgi:pyruvate dehydrogenase E2 component (dihydrolipoamide acetyltransferase)
MAQEIIMPDVGSGVEEGILLNWTKQVGDSIASGDVIAEIETDKATVEVPVTVSGTILQLNGTPGQALRVGAVIGMVGAAGESAAPAPAAAPAAKTNGAAPAAASAPAPAPVEQEVDGNLPDGIKASPVARKIAAERGIDLHAVPGTGPGGRIVKADVEGYTPAAPAPVTVSAPAPAPAPAVAAPTFGKLPEGPDVEIIETSRMRARIAARMVDAKQQTPHFYVTVEVDVEPLLAFRKQINAALDDAHKVSVNDLVVKATALALRDFPNLNTHYYGDRLARHKRIHIGIAVALPNGGLINVVAKDADRMSLSAIAAANKEMIARARDNKVKPDDIQGSTFTVSNLGPYDVEHFLAIINPPEAGILAVGSAKKIPVVLPDGTLGVGNRMKITVSVDHRVSDGAEGAQFVQRVKTLLENPAALV